MRNTGIALPDGVRLNDCFGELCETLAGRDRIADDDDIYRQAKGKLRHHGDDPISRSMIKREAVQSLAEVAMRNAAMSGELGLWVMFDNIPAKVDRHKAHLIQRDTLKLGWVVQSGEPPSALDGRPLWVLLADWRTFKARYMSAREGVEWSETTQCIEQFNDQDREQWIKAQPRMKADLAFKLYRAEARYDGTKQAEFRVYWREIRGTRRGRPRK